MFLHDDENDPRSEPGAGDARQAARPFDTGKIELRSLESLAAMPTISLLPPRPRLHKDPPLMRVGH